MIRLATKKAHESQFSRARVGAVIVRGNRVLSSGVNRIGYSKFDLGRKRPESIHAEAQAILELLKHRRQAELVGADIYISRVDRNNNTRMAKPCNHCAKLIEAVGINDVIYTTDTGTVEEYKT